jgi:hypothetical protein
MGDFRFLPARRHHAAGMAALQFGNAAGVVAMMVRDQYVGELPAGCRKRRLDRSGLRRIDGGG